MLDATAGTVLFLQGFPEFAKDRRQVPTAKDVGVIQRPRPVTLADRPEPKSEDHAGLVFITKYGQPWSRDDDRAAITKEFAKLLKQLGINGRKGLGFYTLRHTFRTAADEAKDQPAADFIMGHEVAHMSSVYRETISDARLKAVTDHVRSWLFPPATNNAGSGGEG